MNELIKNIIYQESPSEDITPLTMAVIPKLDGYGNLGSIIMEEETEHFIIQHTPSKLIDRACKFFGASLKGRQEGTFDVCGITHKAPICIDPQSGMYFFPTSSPANQSCIWIAHSHIDVINKTEDNRTEITFQTGRNVVVDVSYGSMLNQIQRTAQFRYLLDNRIKNLQKHVSNMVAESYT